MHYGVFDRLANWMGEQEMITYTDATTGDNGDWIDIFECEVCKIRSAYPEIIKACEHQHYMEHLVEQGQVGML